MSKERFKFGLHQKISQKQKEANDAEWGRKIANALIPNFTGKSTFIDEYKTDISNYRLMNNILDQNEFEAYCNPMGIDVGQYGEEVMAYNKIPNKVNVLRGEELARKEKFIPILLNERAIYHKDEERRQAYQSIIDKSIETAFLKAQLMNENRSPEEVEQVLNEITQSITPEDLEEGKFLSELEILASNIMEYCYYEQDYYTKKNEAFYHGLVSGKEFTYVGIKNNRPHIELLNPINIFYQKSPEVKYIQHGDWAGRRYLMTFASIMDTWGDRLTEEQLEKLRVPFQNTFSTSMKDGGPGRPTLHEQEVRAGLYDTKGHVADYVGQYGTTNVSRASYYNELVWVTHIEWRSLRKLGFITSLNEYGQEVTDIVDENFPIPENAIRVKYINEYGDDDYKWEWLDELERPIQLTYSWINRIWEATRIGSDVYIDVREKPNQPLNIDNPKEITPLGYHGIIYNNTNAKSISPVSRMKPFQFILFIVMHQFVKLLSRNFGKLLNYDLAQIPSKLARDGFTAMEMVLYYQRQGINFYNSEETSEGTQSMTTRGGTMPPLDASTSQDLMNLAQVADWLDIQIGDAIGITKPREGQINANTNVSDNQQSIVQSANITEIYFHIHNQFWKEVMHSYLNTFILWAKDYFKRNENKKEIPLAYILRDNTRATLRVKEAWLDLCHYGIVMASSGREHEYFDQMVNMLLTLAQNDNADIEDVSYILKSRMQGTSPEEVHKMILDFKKKRDEKEQAQYEAQKEQQQMQERAIQKQYQIQLDGELDKIRTKGEEDRKTELLKAELDDNIDDDKIQIEKDKINLTRDIENKKIEVEKQKIQVMKNKSSKNT